MSNKQSLKDIKQFDSAIKDIISGNKGARDKFMTYMFGSKSQSDKTLESVSETSKSFSSVAESKKRKYGYASDINLKLLERAQTKSTKKIINGLDLAMKKLHKEEGRIRMLTSSKGKNILSIRREKELLKTSLDYSKELIEKYRKQGEAGDSKNITKLNEFIKMSENRASELDNNLFEIKGGQKFVESRIKALDERSENLEETINDKLSELEDMMQDYSTIIDGIETSPVILELQKELNEIRKTEEKTKTELSHLRARPIGGGGAFGKSAFGKAGSAIGKLGVAGIAISLASKTYGAYNKDASAVENIVNVNKATNPFVPIVNHYTNKLTKEDLKNKALFRVLSKESSVSKLSAKAFINKGAMRAGLQSDELLPLVDMESGFVSGAMNEKSNATGLYQFMPKTWNKMIEKYGQSKGISSKFIVKLDGNDEPISNEERYKMADPEVNALMGALFTRENALLYKQRYKKDPTVMGTYMYHFFGSGNAPKFFDAYNRDRDTLMNSIDFINKPAIKKQNPSFFVEGKTVGQVYDMLSKRAKGKGEDIIHIKKSVGGFKDTIIDLAPAMILKTGHELVRTFERNQEKTSTNEGRGRVLKNYITQKEVPSTEVEDEPIPTVLAVTKSTPPIVIPDIIRENNIVDQFASEYGIMGRKGDNFTQAKHTKVDNVYDLSRKKQATKPKEFSVIPKNVDAFIQEQTKRLEDGAKVSNKEQGTFKYMLTTKDTEAEVRQKEAEIAIKSKSLLSPFDLMNASKKAMEEQKINEQKKTAPVTKHSGGKPKNGADVVAMPVVNDVGSNIAKDIIQMGGSK